MKRSDFQPGVKFKIRHPNNILGERVFEYQHHETTGGGSVEVLQGRFDSINVELTDTHMQLFTTFSGILLEASIELERLVQVDSSVTNPTTI